MDDVVFLDTSEGKILLSQSETKAHFSRYQPFYEGQSTVFASAAMVLNTLNVEAPFIAEDPELDRKFTPLNIINKKVQSSTIYKNVKQPKDIGIAGLATLLTEAWPVTVEHYAANSLDLEGFRALTLQALRSKKRRIIANYGTSSLGLRVKKQDLFSPLAAYERTTDHFLIMGSGDDRGAAFWATAEQLFEAMMTLDYSSNYMRDCLIVS